MKDIIIIFVFTISLCTTIRSQTFSDTINKKEYITETGVIRPGIKIGYTSAKIVGADVNRLSNAGSVTEYNGFNVGITVNSELGKYFWLKHDFIFYKQGAVLIMEDKFNKPYKSNLIIHTFTLMPFSPTFHFHGLQLYAGPYVSFVSKATIQRKNEEGVLITDKSFFGSAAQESNYAQKVDIGMLVGLEYEFNFGLNIGARFQRGFLPIIENANSVNATTGETTPQSKIFNQIFSITLGYSFGKSKNR